MMSISEQLIQLHAETETDDLLIEAIVGTCVDIAAGKISDTEQTSVYYTVGELRAIGDFWGSDYIIQEMIASFSGQTINAVCAAVGVSPSEHPEAVIELAEATMLQQQRVFPAIKKELLKRIGPPRKINLEALRQIQARVSFLTMPCSTTVH